MTTAQDQQSRYPAEFETWARDRGLISSSHGLTTEWSSLGVALEAWQAARALPAGMERCNHRIADARNPVVKSGYWCIDCGALFCAADHDGALPAGMEPAFHARGRTALTPGMSWEVCEPSANSMPAYTAAQVQAMLAHRGADGGGESDQKPAQTRMDAGAHPGAGLPIGWQLVPDAANMTDEQAEAICAEVSCCGGGAYDSYRAALAAAPRPPTTQPSETLTQIAAVAACFGDDWPDAPGEPEVLRRVKWAARQLKAAQERAPLTDERIQEIDDETHFHESPSWTLRFARAIEAAQGIK